MNNPYKEYFSTEECSPILHARKYLFLSRQLQTFTLVALKTNVHVNRSMCIFYCFLYP